MPNRLIYAGIFIVCCSLLVSEILLTRIFSVCLWYHFAFFVISIAMFGLGLGGLCVQLFSNWFKDEQLPSQLVNFTIVLALTSLIAPLLLFKTYIPLDILYTFSGKTVLFLSIIFILSSLPFFFGGLITSLLFRNYSGHISKLYFADLVGAGTGCLLTIPLLELFGAANAIIINATLACLGAFCFLSGGFQKSPNALRRKSLVTFIFLICLMFFNVKTSALDVKYAKGTDRSEDEFSKWNSISRISVSGVLADSSAKWIAENIWGVSRKFKGAYPDMRTINIDADAGTLLTKFNGDFKKIEYTQYDPPSIVHRLRREAKTLIIGSGGGKDVLSALSFGAKDITAVELNPIIVKNVMLNNYRDFSGNIYLYPNIKVLADEGRSFVASNREKYDIIQLAYVDTSAATAGGAYILAENNLYTIEAFEQYLRSLRPNGILSICWVDVPGLAGASRLVSTGIAALEQFGIENIGEHISVISYAPRPEWTIRNVLLKTTPFVQKERETLLAVCEELGFEPTYMPAEGEEEVSIGDIKNYQDFIKGLINNKKERNLLYYYFPLNIRPTTDDSPFFFYQVQPGNFLKTIKTKNSAGLIVYTAGTIVLIRVLLIGIVMVCIFYLMPMIVSIWNQDILPYRRISIAPFLCYFSSIGAGFMFIEIVFLQKLLLFLGHPLYTLSVTLLSILFFAGLGSLYTQRLSAQRAPLYIGRAILALLLIIAVYLIYLPLLFKFLLGYPKIVKILVAIGILAPISFLMGMPFPLAVKALNKNMNKIIPWMWGINGATSVVASIVAIILAMNIGYNFTLFVGTLFYFVAFIVGAHKYGQRPPA